MARSLKKKVFHTVGKAVDDWDMIREGDRILLGISGGNDSQALLAILAGLNERAPVRFEVIPAYIDPGFDPSFGPELEAHAFPFFGDCHIEYTDFGLRAHSSENRKNPCFLCSRLRRKRLFEIAMEKDCKKIALAHNKDDIIETFFINIFYSGKTGTMKPNQSFFNKTVDVIRPLAYTEKKDISAFCRHSGLPEFENRCPSARVSKRSRVREMLETVYQDNEHVKGNIFRAMGNVASDYLLIQ